MLIEQETRTIPEAVELFHLSEDLHGAIDELLSSGFHRSELSLLASDVAVEEKLDHHYKRIGTPADDPAVPRSAYICRRRSGMPRAG
jgi:hypothetical protein